MQSDPVKNVLLAGLLGVGGHTEGVKANKGGVDGKAFTAEVKRLMAADGAVESGAAAAVSLSAGVENAAAAVEKPNAAKDGAARTGRDADNDIVNIEELIRLARLAVSAQNGGGGAGAEDMPTEIAALPQADKLRIGNELISQALKQIAEILGLPEDDGAPAAFEFDPANIEQLAAIMAYLDLTIKMANDRIDVSANAESANMAMAAYGMESPIAHIEPEENAAELSGFAAALRTEKFRMDMAFRLIGVSGMIAEKMAEHSGAGTATGIPQAVNPADLGMSVADTVSAFSSLIREELAASADRVRQIARGQADVTDLERAAAELGTVKSEILKAALNKANQAEVSTVVDGGADANAADVNIGINKSKAKADAGAANVNTGGGIDKANVKADADAANVKADVDKNANGANTHADTDTANAKASVNANRNTDTANAKIGVNANANGVNTNSNTDAANAGIGVNANANGVNTNSNADAANVKHNVNANVNTDTANAKIGVNTNLNGVNANINADTANAKAGVNANVNVVDTNIDTDTANVKIGVNTNVSGVNASINANAENVKVGVDTNANAYAKTDTDTANTGVGVNANNNADTANAKVGVNANNNADTANAKVGVNANNNADTANAKVGVNANINADTANAKVGVNANINADTANAKVGVNANINPDTANAEVGVNTHVVSDKANVKAGVDTKADTDTANAKIGVDTVVNKTVNAEAKADVNTASVRADANVNADVNTNADTKTGVDTGVNTVNVKTDINTGAVAKADAGAVKVFSESVDKEANTSINANAGFEVKAEVKADANTVTTARGNVTDVGTGVNTDNKTDAGPETKASDSAQKRVVDTDLPISAHDSAVRRRRSNVESANRMASKSAERAAGVKPSSSGDSADLPLSVMALAHGKKAAKSAEGGEAKKVAAEPHTQGQGQAKSHVKSAVADGETAELPVSVMESSGNKPTVKKAHADRTSGAKAAAKAVVNAAMEAAGAKTETVAANKAADDAFAAKLKQAVESNGLIKNKGGKASGESAAKSAAPAKVGATANGGVSPNSQLSSIEAAADMTVDNEEAGSGGAGAVDSTNSRTAASVRHADKADVPAATQDDRFEVIRQLSERMNNAVRSGANEIRMTLRPEALGEVRMSIRMQGDLVFARMQVENKQVKAIVESNLQSLKDSLLKQNLEFGAIDVEVGANSDGGKSPHQLWQEMADRSESRSGFRETNGVSPNGMSEDGEDGFVSALGSDTGRRFGDNTFEYFA